ncbi:MAG: CRISPR-associated endonuclease Cas2 [Candidatus Thorarchaeota archaeon]|nr:CRISPR-associated endonuclease Cas2 [Candidatus Thorarchaeota archaeon]
MNYIVIYDITEDSLRSKISDSLKDHGLERIQFSAFSGSLAYASLESLEAALKDLLRKRSETDSIVIIPICKTCQEKVQELGEKREILVMDRPLLFA